ncbi:hypothetical protein ACFP56_00780 [Paenibacillus septentrionalis]|uniref:RNA polymerase subunit sigma n=1 Tax=Paenibacillus septentrionalis TaxID=429342 RepID=A0ABW1UXH2_9BACL
MGLNPLNLQLSVPRAPELSNLQQQAMNRPAMEQTYLESTVAKETEQKRTQTSAVDEAEKGIIRDQEKDRSGQFSSKKRNAKDDKGQENELSSDHPYKGHHLDIRL